MELPGNRNQGNESKNKQQVIPSWRSPDLVPAFEVVMERDREHSGRKTASKMKWNIDIWEHFIPSEPQTYGIHGINGNSGSNGFSISHTAIV